MASDEAAVAGLEMKRARLGALVNPADVKSRPVGGGSNALYMTGDVVFKKANDILGFEGWSCEIRGLKTDKAHRSANGKWTVGAMAHMRITTKEGNFHEDIGYGTAENQSNWAAALEKAKKSAVTDGRKRCLRLFGDALGLCIGNKEYQQSARAAKRDVARGGGGGGQTYSTDHLMQAPTARGSTPAAMASGFVPPTTPAPAPRAVAAAPTPAVQVVTPVAPSPSPAPASHPVQVGGTKRPASTAVAAPAPKRAAAPAPATTTPPAPAPPPGRGVPLSFSQEAFTLTDDAMRVVVEQEAAAEKAARIQANKALALKRRQAAQGGGGADSQGSVAL